MGAWLLCGSWSIQSCSGLYSLNINSTDSTAVTWIHTQRHSGGQCRPSQCFVFPVCCIAVISTSDRTNLLYTAIKRHWPISLSLPLSQSVSTGRRQTQLTRSWRPIGSGIDLICGVTSPQVSHGAFHYTNNKTLNVSSLIRINQIMIWCKALIIVIVDIQRMIIFINDLSADYFIS